MSGIQPITIWHAQPSSSNTCFSLLWCKGGVGCTSAEPCQQHWPRVHAIRAQGCGRCAQQLSERVHASSPCLTINHERLTFEKNKHVVVEPCKSPGGVVQWGCRVKSRCCVFGHGHISRHRSHSKPCTPCFRTDRTSFPRPEFCYGMSMACEVMACYNGM
jgi:hypothetical protein